MTEEINPYRAPLTDVHAEMEPRRLMLASNGRRFGTWVVDYVCIYVFAVFIGISIALVFGDEGIEALGQIPNIVLGSAFMITYYVLFEGAFARTPGKVLFRTVVVSENGMRPSFGQVIGRTLVRFIPFEALSFFGERGWHDRASGTYVVVSTRRS